MLCCRSRPSTEEAHQPPLQCTAMTKAKAQCKKMSYGDTKLCEQHYSISKRKEVQTTGTSGNSTVSGGVVSAAGASGVASAIDSSPEFRNVGGRLKKKVFLRVRGVESLKLVEKKISHLVRDSSISAMREKVLSVRGEEAFYTNKRLGPRTRSMAKAAADEAISAATGASDILVPTHTRTNRQSMHVDHTFECQQLAHCIVQTEAFHESNAILLSTVDINVQSDVLSRQPIVVKNFLTPLYSVQNCSGDPTLFNLRLLDDSLNETKGQVVKSFISSRYDDATHNREKYGLRSYFRECAAVKDGRFSKEDADDLASIISKDMSSISDIYCKRLEEKGKTPMYTIYSSPAARSQQDRRIDGLCESIYSLCSELADAS
jgi:hypothetical protein